MRDDHVSYPGAEAVTVWLPGSIGIGVRHSTGEITRSPHFTRIPSTGSSTSTRTSGITCSSSWAGDLVADDRAEVAVLYADGVLGGEVVLSGTAGCSTDYGIFEDNTGGVGIGRVTNTISMGHPRGDFREKNTIQSNNISSDDTALGRGLRRASPPPTTLWGVERPRSRSVSGRNRRGRVSALPLFSPYTRDPLCFASRRRR